MKICRDCSQEKPDDCFVKHKLCKDGLNNLCYLCNRERVKAWRKLNPEKRQLQIIREANSQTKKEYNQNKHLKNTYGISIEDYNNLYNIQQGLCLICKTHQSKIERRFHLDHCHTTGKIRGLLCPECNRLLGCAKDNTEILKNAIIYLEREICGY